MADVPEFPITIVFHVDRDSWTAGSLDELVSTMGWFDSDDPAQAATVTDARARLVRLKIQNHLLINLEVAEDFGWSG